MWVVVVTQNSARLTVHADVIESRNGQTAILARANEEDFLPAHEDVPRL